MSQDSSSPESTIVKKTSKKQREMSSSDSDFSMPYSSPTMASSQESTEKCPEKFPTMLTFEEWQKLDQQEKYSAYMSMACAFMSEIREMRAEFKSEIKKLEEKVERMENQGNRSNSNSGMDLDLQIMMALNGMSEEPKKREEKKKNLVIYRLAEVEDAKDEEEQHKADKALISEMLSKSGAKLSGQNVTYDDVVVKHFRMGEEEKTLTKNGKDIHCPRLVKLQLNSSDVRNHLLRKQRKFLPSITAMQGQEYSQYLREDLTPFQRRLHGKLVRERNRRNTNLKPGQPR